jgi:hypothetical protein
MIQRVEPEQTADPYTDNWALPIQDGVPSALVGRPRLPSLNSHTRTPP